MSLQTLPLPPSELGESPFWHPHETSLYWCDIQGKRVNAWEPASGRLRTWNMPSEPGCCAPAGGAKIVIGLRDGFYLLDAESGALACLALLPTDAHDTRVLRLNDGRCDSAGRFWAGSVISPRTAPDAALWRLEAAPGGFRVQKMAGDNFTANGLAFSPDDRTLYWSNTPEHRIDRFGFDAARGSIEGRTPWVSFPPKTEGQPYGGRPDGAAVDVQGNYWVAMYEGACVLQLSPAGQVLQRIAVPVQCPTMVCFGGEGLRTLYITSARAGRPQEELDAAIPAGSLFSLPVEVPGLPVNFFQASAAM
ncbi:SMP-30/gluconolactonase/LRE family protein [Acidovorax sp.]|jgi:sugar lactone lactonase YvrE|uniref:SMP-30/gluconolactonase/LRE family protein n=1 Tax=Acidovorax sp. TaxID=1872122 RepID=UPI00391F50EB